MTAFGMQFFGTRSWFLSALNAGVNLTNGFNSASSVNRYRKPARLLCVEINLEWRPISSLLSQSEALLSFNAYQGRFSFC